MQKSVIFKSTKHLLSSIFDLIFNLGSYVQYHLDIF